MTLRGRNRLLLILNFLLVGVSAAIIAVTFPLFSSLQAISFTAEGWLYGLLPPFPGFTDYSIVVGTVLAAGIAIVGTMSLRKFFRKNISPILFFLGIALLFHGFSIFRLVQIPLYVHGFGPSWALIATRVVYFLHFSGVLAFFAASTYAAGANNPRLWSVVGLVVTVALALAYAVPLDAARLSPTLVHRFQPEVDLQLLTGLIGVLSVINFVRYVRGNADVAGGSIVTAAGMVWIGRELMIYRADEISQITGGAFLVVGIVLFIRSSYAVYLWT
ncbi:MAG: hypothetical protein ACOC0B_00025 [bacterium]